MLPLIPDRPQKLFSLGDVFFPFDALGGGSVDYTEEAAPLIALGDDHRNWVGGRAGDVADLGDALDRVHDVDGKGPVEKEDVYEGQVLKIST